MVWLRRLFVNARDKFEPLSLSLTAPLRGVKREGSGLDFSRKQATVPLRCWKIETT